MAAGDDQRGEAIGLWVLRGLLAAAPLIAGPLADAALDGRATAASWTATVALWATWLGALVATLVPSSLSLTALRVLTTAGVVAMAVAAVVTGNDAGPLVITAGLLGALAPALTLAQGRVIDALVDGSSYGDERRLGLRTPVPIVLLAAAALSLVIAGAVIGPALLTAEAWLAGGVATVVGWPVALVGTRAIHGLSGRWVVFVPAGLVLSDPLTLAEPVLFPRAVVANLGPAAADTTATDLSGRAPGLALEATLTEPVTVGRRRAREVATEEVRAVLFSPNRPGAVLDEAERRRVRVG